MKEFDYTKWDNKPREMWVWTYSEEEKVKSFVAHIERNLAHPVLAIDRENGYVLSWYGHCAEIEQTRRMTNYELAHWLWEGTQVGEFREYTDEVRCYTDFDYLIKAGEELVTDDIKIRVNGGEWKEPLIEAK